ncbi:MAG: 30S ribosomal protein S16 [Candidatus Paceibacterota bacterium]
MATLTICLTLSGLFVSIARMLSIRLQRIGRKGIPAHRVVVQDSHQSPKSGRVVEILGSYDPRKDAPVIDSERASYWLSNGAQASGTVYNLFVDLGLVKGGKKNVLPKKTPLVKDEPEGEKKEEASSESEPAGEPEAQAPKVEEKEEVKEEPAEEEKKEEPATEEVKEEAPAEAEASKEEEAPAPTSQDESESRPESVGTEEKSDTEQAEEKKA